MGKGFAGLERLTVTDVKTPVFWNISVVLEKKKEFSLKTILGAVGTTLDVDAVIHVTLLCDTTLQQQF